MTALSMWCLLRTMETVHYFALLVILVSLTRSCYGLGEPCTVSNPSNCTGPGVVCGGSNTCLCNSNHYTANGGCREKISLDSWCYTSHNNTDQCAADNAICDSRYGYACKCRSGYYVDPNNATKCKARKPLGGVCQYNTDCTDSNAECSSSKCRC
ncbi:hypothetical protein MAR_018099, partial [Mya arenaria]